MALADRIKLYEQIEQSRSRPLITFVTSSRGGAPGLMAADAIPELLDQLSAIPNQQKAVDLLVVSQGGDPTVAWRAMCLLRERFSTIGVLVPQSAFSAATLLCLGADEIVMHQYGNLGPVDPQINAKRKTDKVETNVRFGYEEVLAFIHFVKDRAHISDQKELAAILAKLFDDIGCVNIGIALRGSMLSHSLGENLLRMHMTADGETTKAKTIAEALNKKFHHHGYALGRQEAKEIGLKVRECDQAFESLIWGVWEDLESDLKMREHYSPMTELASNPACAPLFAPPPVIAFPQGLPPQVANLVWQQIAQQVQIPIHMVPPVDVDTSYAVFESTRICSRFVARRKISGVRQPDGSIAISVIEVSQGWESVPVPVPAVPVAPSPAVPVAPSPAVPVAPSPAVPVAPSPAIPVAPSPAVPVAPSPAVPVAPSPAIPVAPSPAIPVAPSPAIPVAPSPAIPVAPSPVAAQDSLQGQLKGGRMPGADDPSVLTNPNESPIPLIVHPATSLKPSRKPSQRPGRPRKK